EPQLAARPRPQPLPVRQSPGRSTFGRTAGGGPARFGPPDVGLHPVGRRAAGGAGAGSPAGGDADRFLVPVPAGDLDAGGWELVLRSDHALGVFAVLAAGF